MGIIKNKAALATNKLRADALEILEVGYEAILTGKVISEQVRLQGDLLSISGREYDLNSYERIFFVGIGKCALDAALVMEELLGERISEGVVIDVKSGAPLKHLKVYQGSHPLPSEKNVAAARDVAEMLRDAGERDLVIVVISGGGSALLCLPNELRCEELAHVTDVLMKKGASISEINTVRKHTSQIQGGQLAKIAYPAQVVSLIFSDVPGDYVSVIASGPTVLDTTTIKDAERVIDKYHVFEECGITGCDFLETPKEAKYFERVDNILLVTNRVALEAMKEQAEALGYRAQIVSSRQEGEARDLGMALAEKTEKQTCFLYGGETVVHIENGGAHGEGGRNQEVVLAALARVPEGSLVLAAASDGWDNSSFAGAIADAELREQARLRGADSTAALKAHDSYNFYKKVGGYIETGKTGVNVSDFYFVLTE